MIENATEQTTPAAAVAALQAQLDALDDAVGQAAGTWRELAADPSRAAAAAARLGDLERQREILRTALAQAQQAVEQEHASGERQAFQQRAAAVRERLEPLLKRRIELGQELGETVDRMGDLIEALDEYRDAIVRACDSEMTAVSGLTSAWVAQCVGSEDMHHLIDQVLARRLGRAWPSEVAPSSFGVGVADRVRGETEPVARFFMLGVAERSAGAAGATV